MTAAITQPIILRDAAQVALTLNAVTLSLTRQDDRLLECRLTFQVSPTLYDRINTQALFNLKPEVRQSCSEGEFLPDADIAIAISLRPDWFPQLKQHAETIDQAIAYLQQLNEEQPDSPLLFTENWLALSVTQSQPPGEMGYRTLWSYLSPASLAQATISGSGTEISEGIVNFFKDWIETQLTATTQSNAAKAMEGITDFLQRLDQLDVEQLDDIDLDETEDSPSGSLTLETAVHRPTPAIPSSETLLETIIRFFTEDDWTFTKLRGEPMLQLAFQDKGDRFLCFANAREEQQQFVFYSVCPVKVPKSKRRAIAEFLTRVNFGTIIGNFELDMTDGEIRYKTSIDVAGDPLSSTLLKRLIYVNVLMMDDYLPGIRAVLNGKAIEAALQEVEGEEVGSQP